MTGRIFDIQRFAVHDGPGIRTTVFFKGCPLRCLWCGNPESISGDPQLSYLRQRCIGCGECVEACPQSALSLASDGKVDLDRHACNACGICSRRCGPAALQIVGRDASIEDIMAVVLRDREYYSASGGGLTLSGGEPLAQPEFAENLLYAARVEQIGTALETSGYAPRAVVERLAPLVDLWLYDCKETNRGLHGQFTSVGNAEILGNLAALLGRRAKVVLRCPMIPGHNARTDHLEGIASLWRRFPGIEAVELLPYYSLWRAKLSRLGMESRLPESVEPPTAATVSSWREYLLARGVKVV